LPVWLDMREKIARVCSPSLRSAFAFS
jgi:hypothetical protein